MHEVQDSNKRRRLCRKCLRTICNISLQVYHTCRNEVKIRLYCSIQKCIRNTSQRRTIDVDMQKTVQSVASVVLKTHQSPIAITYLVGDYLNRILCNARGIHSPSHFRCFHLRTRQTLAKALFTPPLQLVPPLHA